MARLDGGVRIEEGLGLLQGRDVDDGDGEDLALVGDRAEGAVAARLGNTPVVGEVALLERRVLGRAAAEMLVAAVDDTEKVRAHVLRDVHPAILRPRSRA